MSKSANNFFGGKRNSIQNTQSSCFMNNLYKSEMPDDPKQNLKNSKFREKSKSPL